MKYTRKKLKERFDEIYRFGYCEIPYLCREIEKIGYNATEEFGWNYDVYCFENIAITMGYRNMISLNENEKIRQAIIDANENIKVIKWNYDLNWRDVDNLIQEELTKLLDTIQNERKH